MPTGRSLPTDALAFIQRCVRERKVHWTYHVNMRPRRGFVDAYVMFKALQ